MKSELCKKNMPYPITVQLELTDVCNMHCPMCITSQQFAGGRKTTLSPEFIFSEILTPLKKLGVQWLSVSGGEPTLSPHLLQVLQQARDLGYGIFLATNALSEQLHPFDSILRLMETGRSAIQASFDSLHKNEFNAIRGGDFYDAVCVNIKKLRLLLDAHNYSTKLAVSIVVQEDNAESFPETADFALSVLKADKVIVQLRHDYKEVTKDNWKSQLPPVLSPQKKKTIIKNAVTLFEMSKKDNRIGVIGRHLDNWEAFLKKPSSVRQKCGSGKRIFVDPYGNLRGCIHSPIITNLHKTSILDYLASKPYHDFLSFAKQCNICIHGCAS